jgi:predicted permease
MTSPRWARALLLFVAPPAEADDLVGDYEESHRSRRAGKGPLVAWILSSAEALDLAASISWARFRRLGPGPRSPAEAAKTDTLSGLGVSWLDFRLAFRMLVRFPGLTLVAGLAIAFAIAVGAGTFEFARDFVFPRMPFDGGDRVVEVGLLNIETGNADRRLLHDFEMWRDELESVRELGAFRPFRRNLVTERSAVDPLLGVEISAAALHIARTPPVLGRPLAEADEQPGAANVVLIGYDVWRVRFESDPQVVGRSVRIGSEESTVVGVMPEGFGWPGAYRLWTPLRLRAVDYESGEGPSLTVVGRLPPGVGLVEARAELVALGLRTATDEPDTHSTLRPTVERYGSLVTEVPPVLRAVMLSVNVIAFLALALLVCGNVALLLFARTAARQNEIVVRGALGASRSRIVAQLVAEALVLACVASAVGLAAANAGLGWVVGKVSEVTGGMIGYWFHRELSGGTIVLALTAAVLMGIVSGALPALRLTGTGLQARLQRLGTSGSDAGFGRLWTTVIVAQIAATVAFVPIIGWAGLTALEVRDPSYGFPAEEYLMAELRSSAGAGGMEELVQGLQGAGYTAEYRRTYQEVKRRLSAEPGVAAVTVAEQIPGGPHWWALIAVDGPTAPREEQGYGHGVQVAAVDPDFFSAVGSPILEGRGFTPSDDQAGRHVAVVNEDFVRAVLEGRNAIGRRFQRADRSLAPGEPNPAPWYEIVGVVEQRPMYIDGEATDHRGVYLPLGATETHPVRLAVRVGADPNAFAPRFREIVASVAPDLVVQNVRPLSESAWAVESAYTGWFWVLLVAGGIGVMLAMAGIYSIMSFTVSRRTREIGVRVALGADRYRIIGTILRRAARQVTIGVCVGGVLIALFLANPELGYEPRLSHLVTLIAYLAAMTLVCAIACVVPTRRALAIEPTEALRSEG